MEPLCKQSEALTEQADFLRTSIGGLVLEGVLGGLLKIPPLPDPLGSFECEKP